MSSCTARSLSRDAIRRSCATTRWSRAIISGRRGGMTGRIASRTIAVIGNGIIGHGIAEIFAAAGWRVRLIGRSAQSLTAARAKIRASTAQFVANRLMSEASRKAALGRIKTTTNLEDAKDAELV